METILEYTITILGMILVSSMITLFTTACIVATIIFIRDFIKGDF